MENTEANVTSTKNAVDFGCLFCPSVILKSGIGAEETRQVLQQSPSIPLIYF